MKKNDWAVWPWQRCKARKEPNKSGYWGRCELKKKHDGDHALERGFDTPTWSTDWSDMPQRSHFDANGDLVTGRGQRFRQVGWQVNGGPNDKKLIWDRELPEMLAQPHGGYSPVYVEVSE